MGDIEIPRDIRQYESKLIGPFTTRQAIFFCIAAGLTLFIYNNFKKYLDMDTLFGICFFLDGPILLFGFFNPYGMKMEKFLKTAFVSNVLAPKNRLYKSELYHKETMEPEEIQAEKERMKRYHKNRKKKMKDDELIAYR
jgi:hypothetical protein